MQLRALLIPIFFKYQCSQGWSRVTTLLQLTLKLSRYRLLFPSRLLSNLPFLLVLLMFLRLNEPDLSRHRKVGQGAQDDNLIEFVLEKVLLHGHTELKVLDRDGAHVHDRSDVELVHPAA